MHLYDVEDLDRFLSHIMPCVHIRIGLRVDMLRRGSARWWGHRGDWCNVSVSCRLPRGAFFQTVHSQNTWWKVKVQWRLNVFTRIMLSLSVILLLSLPLSSAFYLFVAFPSGHSCEDRSGGSAPPLTQVRFTMQQLASHTIPSSHNPALQSQDHTHPRGLK